MQFSNLKKIIRRGLFLLALGLIGLTYSCQSSSEKATEKLIEKAAGEDVDLKIGKEKVKIETADGSYTVDATIKSWPKEIPNDVPKFKEDDVLTFNTMDMPEGKNWMVMFENVTRTDVDKYKKELVANGFKIQSTISMPEGSHITASKGKLVVMIMEGEGKATISVAEEK